MHQSHLTPDCSPEASTKPKALLERSAFYSFGFEWPTVVSDKLPSDKIILCSTGTQTSRSITPSCSGTTSPLPKDHGHSPFVVTSVVGMVWCVLNPEEKEPITKGLEIVALAKSELSHL